MLFRLALAKLIHRAPKLLTSTKFVNVVSTTVEVTSKIFNSVPSSSEIYPKLLKTLSLRKFRLSTLPNKPKINVPILWVLGGPGAGKGTQCDRIVEKYGFTHLSTGDLLRNEVQSGSERGKELQAIMEKGALVSVDIVLELLKEAILRQLSNSTGFLIDGYPREHEQGVLFEKKIGEVDLILFFDADEDILVERLLNRAKTSGRADDNEETIKKRLKTFYTYTDDIINNYQHKLKRINAAGSIENIFANVIPHLDAMMSEYRERAEREASAQVKKKTKAEN